MLKNRANKGIFVKVKTQEKEYFLGFDPKK